MSDGSPGSAKLLGVVVPTLNEADYLPALLDDLSRLSVGHEVVVCDGGSTDATREVARAAVATVVVARRGGLIK